MTYHAPVKEMLFVMQALADLAKVVQYPAYAEAGADAELAPAVLEEAAKSQHLEQWHCYYDCRF